MSSLSLVVILIILFFAFVLPAIKKKGNKVSFKKGSSSGVRSPRDYGNVTLDNKLISQRGKGVLDSSAMYSDTKRVKEQAKK